MFLCAETVTLVQLVREDDGERYTCCRIAGASWYGKGVTIPTSNGASIQNTYKVRIPKERMPDGVQPKPGGYLVRGALKDAVQRASADFDAQEHFLVSAIGDNRRGRFAHWAVSGA